MDRVVDVKKEPVVFINIFTVKQGRLEEFVALQRAYLEDSRGKVPGWRGSRLHRQLDGNRAIMVTTFDSIADHQRVHATDRFAEHAAKIRQLVDGVDPGYFVLAKAVGEEAAGLPA